MSQSGRVEGGIEHVQHRGGLRAMGGDGGEDLEVVGRGNEAFPGCIVVGSQRLKGGGHCESAVVIVVVVVVVVVW